MFLATSKVEDFDRWWGVFSTTSLEKRKQHGSKGSQVFHDPNEEGHVWVLFDRDTDGWQSFVSDPDVPAILQQAGHAVGHRSRSSPASSTASSCPRAGGAEEGRLDPDVVLLGVHSRAPAETAVFRQVHGWLTPST